MLVISSRLLDGLARRPPLKAGEAEAAAEPHQLSDRRVHDRHRLANAAVERRVRPAEIKRNFRTSTF